MEWIELDGLNNMRDLGGTTAGERFIAPRRLLRSDNLQDLTEEDLDRVSSLAISDVIDLRSQTERVSTGPGPLMTTPITHHQLSFFQEAHDDDLPVEGEDLPGEALPWIDKPAIDLGQRFASTYAQMLVDRPDTMVNALRIIAAAPGAALVHCAAGKDRTGMVCAFAQELVGVSRADVIADYALTTARIDRVVARMAASPTYAAALDLSTYPAHYHDALPETMMIFLAWVDDQGGVETFLARYGWTSADTEQLKIKLYA